MGFAITEPDAGSDAGAGTTSAIPEGDEWVLNGSKVMIGNGSSADFMLVFCLTDPDNEKKSRRYSIILVETDRKGYEAAVMHGMNPPVFLQT
jgi:alkylation response protein AidB-like acyl-CoA dehydrogenase